jgi:hypothetical protein
MTNVLETETEERPLDPEDPAEGPEED